MAEVEQKRPAGIEAGPGAAVPVVFDGCFGWLHPAAGRRAVVLCGPNGYEALCCHRPWGQFAAALSAAGLPTLRFDYPSTGDSLGDDTDPAILRGALDSIRAAVALVRSQPGIDEVALVGLRFGAVLAAVAAQELARDGKPIDALVLLAPVQSGAAYAKELRMLAMMAQARRPNEASVLPGLEAAGFYYTPATLAEMKALNPAAAAERPAARVLVMDRADNPGGIALGDAFRRLGATVETVSFDRYNALMRDALDAEYPTADFARVVDWIRAEMPAASSAVAPRQGFGTEIALAGGVERPVWIDGAAPLFGILSEPERPDPERPLLLILNTAANHRIGTNRMSVQIARRLLQDGVATLRVDLGGIGDSPSMPGRADNAAACLELVPDVRQVVDWLARRGYRQITVSGLCAGGWLCYHASLVEPRITGQILLNVQDLWPRPKSASRFESNRNYMRLFFSPNTWRRFLKGEVQVRAIARVLLSRLREAVSIRVKRLFVRSTAAETPASRTLADLARLAARGTTTEFVYCQSDLGLDELEIHFGHRGKALAGLPGFQLTFIAEGDHLFSLKASRDHLLELLAARFARDTKVATAPETSHAAAASTSGGKIFRGSLA